MLGEKIYNSDKNVKYLFKEGHPSVNKIIVIFSGYASFRAKIKHPYNYMNTLKDIHAHKLFILDDNGESGSYYFGENLNFDVDSSVISLILDYGRRYNISNENIITLGSSKGGTAALYFGLKYKLGAVFAGAFQTKISDYITSTRSHSAEFLFNNDNKLFYQNDFNQLNNVIFNLLNTPIYSNLYLISSENDWQYKVHVAPFMKKLDQLNIAYDFHLSEEMKNHSEISIYFPKYFIDKLIHELFNIHFQSIDLKLKKHSYTIKENSLNLSKNKFKIVFYHQLNSKITGIEPNKDYTPKVPGFYNFYVAITDSKQDMLYKKLLGTKYYSAEILEKPRIELYIIDKKLHFNIDINSTLTLKFAYYVKENGKVINKIMYSNKRSIIVDVKKGKKYSVQYFIMTNNGIKIVNDSNTVLA